MKFNYSNLMFSLIMMLGVMISLSSNNLFLIWMGLEISFMSFMPMMSKNSIIISHSSVKYFIIQSISSLLMMLGMLMMMSKPMSNVIMSMSILIKIALFPFHSWIIMIIEEMDYVMIMYLLTLMKLPLINIISMLCMKLDMSCTSSMICSSLMMLNQCSMRKIMAYSSIFNMGFMISSCNINSIWITYMIVYTMLMAMIFYFTMMLNINYINQSLNSEINMKLKMNLTICLLSMGGMPPMMGFTIKMMVIETIMLSKNLILLITIMFSSALTMFTYMRISFSMIMISSMTSKWTMLKMNKSTNLMSMLNILTTPIIMMMKSTI